MARHGPRFERRQLLLAMSVSASRAHALGDDRSLRLARYVRHRGEHRIRRWFDAIHGNADDEGYRLARELLDSHPSGG